MQKIIVLFLVNAVGEWWNNDVEEVVKKGNLLGLPPDMSDAHTINGKPGPLFPCSEKRKPAPSKERLLDTIYSRCFL